MHMYELVFFFQEHYANAGQNKMEIQGIYIHTSLFQNISELTAEEIKVWTISRMIVNISRNVYL